MTVTNELIEKYAAGAYSARDQNMPLFVYQAHFREFAEALTAALSAQPAVSVPDGWKLVPVEPTFEMVRADPGTATTHREIWNAAMYRAMLAAAPQPPMTEVDIEEVRERKLETVVAPDNGTVEAVLSAVLDCANAWVPEARIVGNVRAGDIARAVRAVLTTAPQPVAFRWQWKSGFHPTGETWMITPRAPAFDPDKRIEPLYTTSPADLQPAQPVDAHSLAVEIVDGVLGYSVESSADPDRQRALYGMVAERILSALTTPPADLREENEQLKDAGAPMACGGEDDPMTAAEEVLTWLLIEKIGAPDDVHYSPNQAQEIIARVADRAAAAEARVKALEEQIAKGCEWYWPADDTSSDMCADGVWGVRDNVDLQPGEILHYATGGVLNYGFYAFLEAAEDADSDDEFEVDAPTEEEVRVAIDAELARRAALKGGEA